MASLTPLSKGLIALIVIGGMASAVWHLGLKDKLGGGTAALPTPAPAPVVESKPAQASPPAAPAAATVAPASQPAAQQPATAQVAPPPVSEAAPPPRAPKTESKGPESKLSVAENAEAGRKLAAAGDFEQARKHLELAVQGGDGASACRLGEMTLKGQGGIAASQEKAAALFQMAQSHNIICFASGK